MLLVETSTMAVNEKNNPSKICIFEGLFFLLKSA
jgi:hypothetical protein